MKIPIRIESINNRGDMTITTLMTTDAEKIHIGNATLIIDTPE